MTMLRRVLISLCSLVAAAASAAAQTNERIYESLNFRFVTPGARAVGMGHTFVGLADDATSASSNPAGLSNLLEPEFSIEFNLTQIRHERFMPGDEAGTRTFGDTVLTPSFFSFAVPVKRATILVFRNTIQHHNERFEIPPRLIPSLGLHEDGAFGTIAARAENYGIGGAFVVSRHLSVGASLVLTTLDIATDGRSGDPLQPRNGTTTIDSARDVGVTAGVLFKPRQDVSIGAAYYGGARFNLNTTLFGRFLFNGGERVLTGDERPVRYVIPDRFAVGASWRVRNALTVLADVARVRYSRQITKDFLIVDFLDPGAGLTHENFVMPDVTELHAGVEYRWYGRGRATALRAGVFTDPDHQMRFRSGANDPNHVADAMLAFRFNSLESRTAVGFTTGGGIAFGNQVQIDAAVSVARTGRQAVLSTVIRLPK
ncbi:MAG: outer membrane protein transport protein [Vicinamibacterales bacterium]